MTNSSISHEETFPFFKGLVLVKTVGADAPRTMGSAGAKLKMVWRVGGGGLGLEGRGGGYGSGGLEEITATVAAFGQRCLTPRYLVRKGHWPVGP